MPKDASEDEDGKGKDRAGDGADWVGVDVTREDFGSLLDRPSTWAC